MEIRYVQPTEQPQTVQSDSLSQSAIHALMVTDNFTPEQAFRLLLAQACRFGQLPAYLSCIHGMLRAAGYRKHNATYDTLNNAAQLLTKLGADRAIVRLGGHYAPILRAEDGSCYALKTAIAPRFGVYTELWLPYPAGKTAPAPRPPKPSAPRPVPEHSCFRFFQPNPLLRPTGDCVLRAMAGVLQMDWAEAMYAIAQAGGWRSTVLNEPGIFEQLLEQKGFVRHEKEVSGKVRMTGCEFCQWAAEHYTHGEPIFAYIGRSHVAAVLPEQQPDGTFRYAIHDCWDSTARRVTAYWVRPFRPVKAATHVCFAVGQEIVHPAFGIGRIVHIHGEDDSLRLTVAFAQGETRMLSGAWVHAHCSLPNTLSCPA